MIPISFQSWLDIVQVRIQFSSKKTRTAFFKCEFHFQNAAQAHSSVERAGLLGGVKLRSVPADANNQLRGETLEQFIREDLDKGLIPFYVSGNDHCKCY